MAPSAKFGVLEIRMEVPVAAPRRRVWAGLTRDIGEWWPRHFLTQEGSRRFVLEPRVGGRAYEDAGGGQGLLWWTVLALRRERMLLLAGDLTAAYGGPARILDEFTLVGKGGGTTLRYRGTVHGRIGKDLKASLEEGWGVLLLQGLKPWAEKGS